jgi:hypothetical protein
MTIRLGYTFELSTSPLYVRIGGFECCFTRSFGLTLDWRGRALRGTP